MEETLSNEIGSELTNLNKGEKEKLKKYIIIGVSIGSLFIMILIIIIIFLANSNSSNSNNSKDHDIPILPIIGEINAIFNIQKITEETYLLGNDFKKDSDFDIYIDGKAIKYSKEYKFNSLGNHLISIKLF